MTSNRIISMLIVCLMASATASLAAAQTTWYVDDDAPLGGDGASWATAFRYLQDSLAAAASDPLTAEIRVAGGEYYPDQDEAGAVTLGDRNAAFQMLSGVVIKGGYRGYDGLGNPDDRDIALYETELSGDISSENWNDNSYHVVNGSGVDNTAVMDGVTIAHGATSIYNYVYHGGGVFIVDGSPRFIDCVLRDNRTARSAPDPFIEYDIVSGHGGGLYCFNGSPELRGCTIQDNIAAEGRWGGINFNQVTFYPSKGCNGGGLFFKASSPLLVDCLVSNNQAGQGGPGSHQEEYLMQPKKGGSGGGVYFDSCNNVRCIRCVFEGNAAGRGGEYGDLYGVVTSGGDGGYGGGVLLASSQHVYMDNCEFRYNFAGSGYDSVGYRALYGAGHGGGGGGIHILNCSDVNMINCQFADNEAGIGGTCEAYEAGSEGAGGDGGSGGGVYCDSSGLNLVNCTFAGNQAALGGEGEPDGADGVGGGANIAGGATLSNCIFWNNEAAGTLEEQQTSGAFTINYSCVEGWTGGLGGAGNIGADPLFADAPNGDYSLLAASPCIDAGDDTAVPADAADVDGDGDVTERIPLDLAGLYRFADRPGTADTGVADPPNYPYVVDMGAYEFGIEGDFNGDGVVNLSDLAALLANYGQTSGVGYLDGDLDGDGDVDLSDLATILALYGDVCP